jgi:DNA-binding response OmpR family regulator
MDGAGMRCDLLKRETDVLLDGDAMAIIDIGKPLIHGVELYTRLRRQGHTRPAIIVTKPGHQGGDALDALRDVAVTGILNKPFDPLALLQRLEILAA